MKKICLSIALLIISMVGYSQSSNVTLVSKWAHGRWPNAICANGNYAYVATDSVVTIVDVSNPSLPKGVGQFIVSNTVGWIQVINSKAYIAQGISGLCIVDVSDPRVPVKMGTCSTSGSAKSVKVYGNYAYVAADNAGLRIIDIGNPNIPVETGFFNLGTSSANDVDVFGNYAYIAYGGAGLYIVDISNPVNPVATGFLANSYATSVFISGNHAYLVVDNGLSIVNITNPSLPLQEGSTGTGGSADGNLFVFGSYLYEVHNSAGSSLSIWDVNNSFAPVLVNDYLFNSSIAPKQQLCVIGNRAFFLTGTSGLGEFCTMDIVDVTNPTSLSTLGKYRMPEYSTGICTSGNYVYEGGWTAPDNEIVSIIDIADPYHPQEVGFFKDTLYPEFGSATNLFKAGNYLYISGTSIGSISTVGVKIIDVSNPANPVRVGIFAINNASANGISVNGNYAYICYGPLGLVIADVSNPALPVQVSTMLLTGGFGAVNISLFGSHAYIIDNAGKLHIINISNPAAPSEEGYYQLAGTGTDIMVDGNYAYVAVGALGFQIIDVSVPSAPVLSGAYTAVPNNQKVKIYKLGNYVYLSDYVNGLQLIDVSNPASPVQAGYFYDCFGTQNVYADNLHSYVTGYDGLHIFDASPTTTSVAQLEQTNQFSVFPNPFESSVTISSEKQTNGTITCVIKNMEGQVLYSKQENEINGIYKKMIDLNFIPKGIYLLDVTTGDKRSVKKIVKM